MGFKNNITIILGKSGIGKTSYLKNILAMLEPKHVGYLPQNVADIFNYSLSVEKQITEVCSDKGQINHILKLLHLDNLIDNLKKYPTEFSLGELQRLALLIILLRKDLQIILLDEPTSALDNKNQKNLVDIIKSLKVKKIFITTHSHYFAYFFSKDYLIKTINNDHQLVDYKITEYKSPHMGNFIKSADMPLHNLIAECKNILITGKSGVGKSVFLKNIFTLLSKQDKSRVALVTQEYASSLSPRFLIKETLFEALKLKDPKISRRQAYRAMIQMFWITNNNTALLKRYPNTLSCGEKQKILILRALSIGAKIILLDEPTSHMDTASIEQIMQFIQKVMLVGSASFIIVSHSDELFNYPFDCLIDMDVNKINYFTNSNKAK